MSLSAQAQSLNTLDELKGAEWVERTSQITQDFDSNADGKCDGSESLPELQSVVAWGWLDHLRETFGVLAPVELS
jgi:hypothetical protein